MRDLPRWQPMGARRSAAVAVLAAAAVVLAAIGLAAGSAGAAFASLAAARGLVAARQGGAFCGDTGAVDAIRGELVVMNSQGQGGRFNFGQRGQVTLKGAKKKAVTRHRKPYGSHGARKTPRRYPIYDILEDLEKRIPTYTVISEPEEPLQPVWDVPLTERYPWAGSLEKVPQAKIEKEDGPNRLEPYFGDYTREVMPPKGRRQLMAHRRGWQTYNYPPWMNKPIVGRAVWVPKSMEWKSDRRPQPWQYYPSQKEEKLARFGAVDMDELEEVED